MIEHTNNIDIGQVEVVYNVESYAPRRHFFGAGSQFWCIFGRMTHNRSAAGVPARRRRRGSVPGKGLQERVSWECPRKGFTGNL